MHAPAVFVVVDITSSAVLEVDIPNTGGDQWIFTQVLTGCIILYAWNVVPADPESGTSASVKSLLVYHMEPNGSVMGEFNSRIPDDIQYKFKLEQGAQKAAQLHGNKAQVISGPSIYTSVDRNNIGSDGQPVPLSGRTAPAQVTMKLSRKQPTVEGDTGIRLTAFMQGQYPGTVKRLFRLTESGSEVIKELNAQNVVNKLTIDTRCPCCLTGNTCKPSGRHLLATDEVGVPPSSEH